MNAFEIINLSRRGFLKAGAGLTLGVAVPSLAQMAGEAVIRSPSSFVASSSNFFPALTTNVDPSLLLA